VAFDLAQPLFKSPAATRQIDERASFGKDFDLFAQFAAQ
jgi:hypothetical protein